MNKSHITIIRKSHALRILLITILIIATLTILYSSNTAKNTPYPSPLIQPNLVTSYSASKDELQNHEDNKQEQQLVASKVNFHDVHYQVKQGDNLESIFNHQNISGNTLSEILEADEQYLDIDVLKPGEQLTFRFDNHNKLAELMFVSNPSKTILYQRHDAEHFEHKQKLIPTQWVTDVVRGTIKN
ncbi:MAG TPA: hypothetical protein ENH74_03725, partial [Methylophaga sp.]|nr:hypothetical protein [Methylophaga sp.]